MSELINISVDSINSVVAASCEVEGVHVEIKKETKKVAEMKITEGNAKQAFLFGVAFMNREFERKVKEAAK